MAERTYRFIPSPGTDRTYLLTLKGLGHHGHMTMVDRGTKTPLGPAPIPMERPSVLDSGFNQFLWWIRQDYLKRQEVNRG